MNTRLKQENQRLANEKNVVACCLVDYMEARSQHEAEFLAVSLVLQYSHQFSWITKADLVVQTCSSLLVSQLRCDKTISWTCALRGTSFKPSKVASKISSLCIVKIKIKKQKILQDCWLCSAFLFACFRLANVLFSSEWYVLLPPRGGCFKPILILNFL